MELIAIKFNDAAAFDASVSNGLPEGGDLTLITKDRSTAEGRAAACLTFTALVDGKEVPVQVVTSVRILLTALAALKGRYDEDGKARH